MGAMRFVTLADAGELAGIYAPYVRDTVVTLELEPPTADEFAGRIEATVPAYPYLAWCEGGRIVGYAYAAAFNARPGYRFSVTASVYLRPEAAGRGLGRRLYGALFALLERQGYRNAYALITLPNDRSVRLHERFGFATVGVYHGCGYKLGQWVDVACMEKRFAAAGGAPAEPVSVDGLDVDFVQRILAGHE